MLLSEVIGQEPVKQRLLQMAASGRVPHALLFISKEGTGALPLAVAYAQYLNCTGDKSGGDSCGKCPSCRMFQTLAHPDLHFVFPVIRDTADSGCDTRMDLWRETFNAKPYFSLQQWLDAQGGNKQGQIPKDEAARIHRLLSMKGVGKGYKVMVIWCPELMNETSANNILKILEEPPARTIFLLVSERAEDLLATILSRTQRVNVPPIAQEDLVRHIKKVAASLDDATAQRLAHVCAGNAVRLYEIMAGGEEETECLDFFSTIMRTAFKRDTLAMMDFSQTAAKELGREQLKARLLYCLRMVRESFVYNLQAPELNYLSDDEEKFLSKFAVYIHNGNVAAFMRLFNEAILQIEQNANGQIILFQVITHAAALIKQKPMPLAELLKDNETAS